MNDIRTSICNKIWKTGEWPTTWIQSLVITLPKKSNLQLCQNYRTISLISHHSKVMLKIILNRLQPQAEEIIAEEQAGFRAGRSTTELIFNLRILCEKYLQHQQNLYHVFIDFIDIDLWFLTVTCSCCPYLYFGSAIMLVTYFVNFR